MPQPTLEQMENVATRFEEKWQMPHVLGAIDGKHIRIKKPALSFGTFYNYKQYHSIVLLGKFPL